MSTQLFNHHKNPSTTPNTEDATVYESEGSYGQSNFNYTRRSYPMAVALYGEVVQSVELFQETLQAFHQSFGTKFKVPTVGGRALDLHHLFVEVTSRGGLEKIIRDRKWKEVIVVLNFSTTVTSASFVLRKYYLSLLYHFEQVYYFNKKFLSISNADIISGYHCDGSATANVLEEGVTMEQLSGSPKLLLGSWITGIIDGKFDNGYLASVNLVSNELKGVLYHIPHALHISGSFKRATRSRPNRKRSRLVTRDPSQPKPNRSGYNFFFAEHYGRLKPLYYGQEKVISKKIGLLWSKLSEAEKQVYQDKGLRDKERYRTEMFEYRSTHDSRPQ